MNTQLPFSSRFGAELSSPESVSYVETFLRRLVREEVERKFEACCNNQSSSSKLNYQNEAAAGSRTAKFKLCFLNNIPSIIFTTNHIGAENGEPLQVVLCDIPDNNVVETTTHPLSSALIEFVVLDGEFGCGRREEEIHWNVEDFNKSVVTRRVGERPLLVGKSKTTRLKNGVAFIDKLAFTANSSRTRTKTIRLGVRIIDDEILANYPRIGEAISNPFRVMDHRGEGTKKHHPPKGEDEVWRLEGISKDGEYHKHLSLKGIENVDGFVKAYKRNPHSLKKLLGKKVSKKKWKAMVKNALEYNPPLALSEQNLVENYDESVSETFFDRIQHYFNIMSGDINTDNELGQSFNICHIPRNAHG